MPKFTVKTKRIIVLGVLLLGMTAFLVGEYQLAGVVAGGLLALLKDDSDSMME